MQQNLVLHGLLIYHEMDARLIWFNVYAQGLNRIGV